MTRLLGCDGGAPEAEIFVLKFLPWPGFEPRTSQSNGRERHHSTITVATSQKRNITGAVRISSKYKVKKDLMHVHIEKPPPLDTAMYSVDDICFQLPAA